MRIVLPLLAFAALATFLGILLYRVPRLDLGTVIVATLVLAAMDFFVKREKG